MVVPSLYAQRLLPVHGLGRQMSLGLNRPSQLKPSPLVNIDRYIIVIYIKKLLFTWPSIQHMIYITCANSYLLITFH